MTLNLRGLRHRPQLAAAAAFLSLAAVPGALAATPSTPTKADTSYTTRGAWSYVSAPNLHPPKVRVDARGKKGKLATGDFFVGVFKNLTSSAKYVGQGGPLILDSHMQPVWFKPVSGLYVNNLRVQTYNGKPALSWWQGVVTNTGATTQGEDVVVDQHYHQVAAVTGADGWTITQHEMLIQGHDAWVTVNKLVTVAAGTVPGCATCTSVIDAGVQELNLTNGQLVRPTWDAMANIPFSQVEQPASPSMPWDAYHINSVQLLSGGSHGRFLTSMRNTWAAYLVDIASGQIQWTLGGKASSFTFAKGAQFQWQHDVELHSNNLVTVFDDACCEITGPGKFAKPNAVSHGLLLRLNMAKHTASYVHGYYHTPGALNTAFQGGSQLLHSGNVVVGWGSAPFFSEFTSTGKTILDAMLPGPDVSYRTYVFNWVGLPPRSEMRQKAKTSHGKTTVYASWNGATQVVAWRLLAGSGAKHLSRISTTAKTSFETVIPVKGSYKTYELQALDSHGHVLGTSSTFGVATPPPPQYGGY